ncbi:acetolactate synthase 3 regulatory subunit domain protein [Brevundimonas naejangsanensis]|uniref:Acetolactate synthase 3 regulatory subunit domain protein n=3 Tax=Brevundimonas TaxID=41275 RepID=A0A494RJX8_9CAUL|nr:MULTISPECIES: ACT domain-containing protein [Brevundimonas]ANF55317.1 acetolactate synthase 3 regulatory subunit domain protein [Brevundimonas naejangsanensis]AYG94790.1 acetolactate synthase 3 regulatory subunit domain protein [Brevundimonas naejangsanensis]MCH4268823.1 ACT domain-containing protein [Brevundimonas sp.]QBQ49546.1 acetolactate synthase 3 regulatory subunit domain protein [Brevundimonas naejangsanensis]RIJ66027.1 acetolactate synthase 3 regulatory subunit domain protein [Brev
MSDTIHIQIDRADGSLQRLIGLVERRGFHIDGINMADEGAMRRIALTVRGRDAARSIDTLGRQIDRLIGVARIQAQTFQSEAA